MWQTDRQTDRHLAMAYTCYAYASSSKNFMIHNDTWNPSGAKFCKIAEIWMHSDNVTENPSIPRHDYHHCCYTCNHHVIITLSDTVTWQYHYHCQRHWQRHCHCRRHITWFLLLSVTVDKHDTKTNSVDMRLSLVLSVSRARTLWQCQ